MGNAKHRLEWCKARRQSLEWWLKLHHLAVWWTNLGLADARRTLICPNA
jgi:hypothetical protein